MHYYSCVFVNVYLFYSSKYTRYGPFAVERYKTTKKIKFMFISQKCSKYCNLSRFHINSFFIFFGVSYLSTAKGPYWHFLLSKWNKSKFRFRDGLLYDISKVLIFPDL